MTVDELIQELKQVPGDSEVRIIDTEWGAEPVHDVRLLANGWVVIGS